MTKHMHADVAVIGAGPTGAFAARLLAEIGLRTLLVDRRSVGETGAQWINGVPEWVLQEVGLDALSENEVFSRNDVMNLFVHGHDTGVRLPPADVVDLDMRVFGKRLIDEFLQQPNAKLLHGLDIHHVDLDTNERPIAVVGTLQEGGKSTQVRLQARLFVDASGIKAVLRKNIPRLHKLCPPPERENLCSAAQEVYAIDDAHAAQRFLDQKNSKAGEIVSYIGVAGGFSLLRAHVSHDLQRVSFLSGAQGSAGNPSGKEIIFQFTSQHPWVGQRLFGGQRAIPLRRPYSTLASPGVALIGDSGCQVYATHASGIGMGLLAAQILAEEVAKAARLEEDIGAHEVLWGYSANFHRRHGYLLHTSDLFRRFTQTLDTSQMERFLKSGLLSATLLNDALAQRNALPSLKDIPSQALSAIKHNDLLRKAGPIFARFPLIAAHCLRYPKTPFSNDGQGVWLFESRMQRLIDDAIAR